MPPSSTSPTSVDSAATRHAPWFAAYAADHRHPLNQRLHQWCVPAILWSVVALLYAIPPFMTPIGAAGTGALQGDLALVASLLAVGFWAWLLPWRLSLVMAGLQSACWVSSAWLWAQFGGMTLVVLAGLVFVVAWIGQFYGHRVEGRRPSFFTDLVYLMIGPPWVVAKVLPQLLARGV